MDFPVGPMEKLMKLVGGRRALKLGRGWMYGVGTGDGFVQIGWPTARPGSDLFKLSLSLHGEIMVAAASPTTTLVKSKHHAS